MSKTFNANVLRKFIQNEIRSKSLNEAIKGRNPGDPLFEAPEDAIGLSSKDQAYKNMREIIEARLLDYGGWEKNKYNELYIRWVVDDIMKILQAALEEGYEQLRVSYDLDELP